MAAASPCLTPEDFWDDLLAYIEAKAVIPVVGAELLTIETERGSVPLYREVAERLLAKYGLSFDSAAAGAVTLREHRELNDAVCALAASGRRSIKDLYRPVYDILRGLLEHCEIPTALQELASITDFDLFASATPDDLLARALNKVRFHDTAQTDEIEYAPKLPTERRRDLPVSPSSNYTAVFYLFGKANVAPFYAIHEEDALEFPYTLQAGGGPERVFSQLRSRNLLLIGCTFADWLSPFFLRLSNSERLFSDRNKKEFLVGEETAKDKYFTIFLERFSHDTRCYQIESRAFVSELHRRWHDRNPVASQQDAPARVTAGSTIFVSYAGEDVGSAKAFYNDLQEIGGDVAWFDKSNLRPGDKWLPEIQAAIQKCSMFVPLLSTNTEQRNEGYFREEWEEAATRARRIAGRKFIIPVVIDEAIKPANSYQLIPDSFRGSQFGHAPAGRMTQDLKAEFQLQLRELRRGRA